MDNDQSRREPLLSTLTLQPCIVGGCTGVRISDRTADPPFGICEPHLDQLRTDSETYGIVCLRCRRLVYVARVSNRPKTRKDLLGQVLFIRRCTDCGGSAAQQEFFTWEGLGEQW